MKRRRPRWIVLFGMGVFLTGCLSEQAPPPDAMPAGELAMEAPWARPGFEGGMSAVYVKVANGTGEADTLVAVRAPVADTAEIHESYEGENDTRGMRRVSAVPVPAGQRVELAPGGLHVMLIQLKRALQAGDSLAIEMQFARVGTRSLNVPVRLQSPPAE